MKVASAIVAVGLLLTAIPVTSEEAPAYVREGDRMIVGLMRMPAGTGAEPHSHPNEQWIYILEGTFRARIGETELEGTSA